MVLAVSTNVPSSSSCNWESRRAVFFFSPGRCKLEGFGLFRTSRRTPTATDLARELFCAACQCYMDDSSLFYGTVDGWFFFSPLRRSILVKVAPPVFVPLRLSRPTFGPGFPTDTEGCCGAVVVLLLLLLACSRIIPCWHISFFPQPQSFPYFSAYQNTALLPPTHRQGWCFCTVHLPLGVSPRCQWRYTYQLKETKVLKDR